jgi:hypothetical protein
MVKNVHLSPIQQSNLFNLDLILIKIINSRTISMVNQYMINSTTD